MVVGTESEKNLPVLMEFGNVLIQKSTIGSELKAAYSSHNKELEYIFAGDEELRIQARGFIQRYIEIMREVANNDVSIGTKNRVFTPGDAKTLKIFLHRL